MKSPKAAFPFTEIALVFTDFRLSGKIITIMIVTSCLADKGLIELTSPVVGPKVMFMHKQDRRRNIM